MLNFLSTKPEEGLSDREATKRHVRSVLAHGIRGPCRCAEEARRARPRSTALRFPGLQAVASSIRRGGCFMYAGGQESQP